MKFHLKEIHRILKVDGRLSKETPFEKEFDFNMIHGDSFLFLNLKSFKAIIKPLGFYINEKNPKNPLRKRFLLRKRYFDI